MALDLVKRSAAPASRRLTYLALAACLAAAAVLAATAPEITVAAAAAGAILWFLSSESRLKYGLVALALYTPFEEFALKWVPERHFFIARFAPLVLLAAALGIVVLRRMLERRPLGLSAPINLPLALFLALSVASMVANQVPLQATLISYQPLLRFIVLAYFLVQVIDFDRRDAGRLLAALFAVVLLEASIGLVQSAGGVKVWQFLAPAGARFGEHLVGGLTQALHGGRYNIFGTLARYNIFGGFIGLFLVLSVPFVQRHRRFRPLFAVLYAVAIPALILAAARAPWLAVALGCWTIFALKRQVKALAIPLVLVALIAASLPLLLPRVDYHGVLAASPFDRLLEPFSERYREVAAEYGRLYYLVEFPAVVLEKSPQAFFIGFGPGSLGRRAIEISGLQILGRLGVGVDTQGLITDVTWAYLFGQTGLLGLGLFLWMIWRVARTALEVRRGSGDGFLQDLATAFLGIVVFYLCVATFLPAWEVRSLSLYFWLFAGILLKLRRQEGPST